MAYRTGIKPRGVLDRSKHRGNYKAGTKARRDKIADCFGAFGTSQAVKYEGNNDGSNKARNRDIDLRHDCLRSTVSAAVEHKVLGPRAG